MAADGHLRYTKMAIEVMFGSRVGFPAELRFIPYGLHTRTAVARNPCVSWAFFFVWQLQLIILGLSSIALSNYIGPTAQLSVLFTVHTIVLSPCNHKNINCRSDWMDQGRIERGTPTPGHLWM